MCHLPETSYKSAEGDEMNCLGKTFVSVSICDGKGVHSIRVCVCVCALYFACEPDRGDITESGSDSTRL